MKNMNTKNALVTSVVALFLCFAMLLGTTFAWFTDSATSADNKIVAGTLQVDLLLDNGSGYTSIKNSPDPIFGSAGLAKDDLNTLWEPGKTQVAYLAIANTGSLDLKYKVNVNVTNYTNDLYEVMEYAITPDATAANPVSAWTDGVAVVPGVNATAANDVSLAAGATHYFALSLHMNEEAGNDYQGGTIDFDISVLAAQDTSEEDSFGPDYDKLAVYGGQGKTAVVAGESVNVQVLDEDNLYKVGAVEVPAAAIADGAEEIEVIIAPTTYEGTFTITDGYETMAFDVDVIGLKEGNTTPVKTMLKIPAGKDPATVSAYHYSDAIADATYNPETGYVTFYTTDYSPFTVVFDNDSVYVAPEATPEGLPKANVVNSSEYENVDLDWGSYGAWSPTEGLDSQLEAAYTFTCIETLDQAKLNAYANWYCDFYVMLDEDLGENEIFLGGNYGSFGWVGFHNGDLTLDANTEIGLLESVTTNPWTYLDVVQNVGTFICGVGDVDDALSGATFTVMLRLTNPENAEEFYNVATIEYTFE